MNKATMYDLEREQFDIIKWNLRKPLQDTGKKTHSVPFWGELGNSKCNYYINFGPLCSGQSFFGRSFSVQQLNPQSYLDPVLMDRVFLDDLFPLLDRKSVV